MPPRTVRTPDNKIVMCPAAQKECYSRSVAKKRAKNYSGDQRNSSGVVDAYECPNLDQHPEGAGRFHVGHRPRNGARTTKTRAIMTVQVSHPHCRPAPDMVIYDDEVGNYYALQWGAPVVNDPSMRLMVVFDPDDWPKGTILTCDTCQRSYIVVGHRERVLQLVKESWSEWAWRKFWASVRDHLPAKPKR